MKNLTKEELTTKVTELTESNRKLEQALSASMQNTLVYLGIRNYAVPGTDILTVVCYEKGVPYFAGITRGPIADDPASFNLQDRAKEVTRKSWEYLANEQNERKVSA